MSQFILANTVNFLGTIIPRGKLIDSACFNVAALSAVSAGDSVFIALLPSARC